MRPTTLTLFDAAFLETADAQGPAGITPTSFGQPTRWYDANSFGLANDSVITINDPWDDQSPNDDDAVTTLTNEPTFHSNVINGRPVVRFTGSDHMLFEGGDLELADFTILCVGLTGADSTYLGRNGFNRQVRTNRLDEDRASWFSGNSGSELVSNQFLSNASLPRMIGHRRNLTTTGLFTFFDNATSVMPTTGGVNPGSFGINEIGTLAEFTPGINMDIAELVIYNRAFTDDEVLALYNDYFKPKFALP